MKKARIRWGKYQQNRPDEKQLCKWFANGRRNMAVILGEVSGGLACRDFDTIGAYKSWAKRYQKLTLILPTVKTGKGYHVYFIADIEGRKDIKGENGEHLGELRGNNHYCMLPPSLHPDGQTYVWVNLPNNGNLLTLDPEKAGFFPENTHVTEHTEHIEQTEHTEAIIEEVVFKKEIKKVIKRTLPKTFGTRNRKIFKFAKAFRTMYPNANPLSFRKAVKKWHELALVNIRTKDFAETWFDFLVAWDNVNYFEGVNPMVIYEHAIKLEPPKKVALIYPDNQKIQNLAVLCREMQKACDDKPFFLSARTAAGLLEISAMQANRYLRLLVKEDVLVIVEKGGTKENPRKATRFRYVAN